MYHFSTRLILSDHFDSFVWGGCALVVFVWAYFRLPETKGRTFDELDTLFAKRVPARKFASTDVDAFDEELNDQLATQYARK
jgi:SP family general alpha glucoside:H+ symporter-like MFS transporter